jgi:hypothetical protein
MPPASERSARHHQQLVSGYSGEARSDSNEGPGATIQAGTARSSAGLPECERALFFNWMSVALSGVQHVGADAIAMMHGRVRMR